jgi:hypothetical protein
MSLFQKIVKWFYPNTSILENPISGNRQDPAKNKRGINVYSPADLMMVSAKDKEDDIHNVPVELVWTETDSKTRLLIYQKCVPVFSVVTGQSNKIAALDWKVSSVKEDEEKIVQDLKDLGNIYKEIFPFIRFDNGNINEFYFARAVEILRILNASLDDLLPDLSNFQSCLYRFKKRIDSKKYIRAKEIEDFMRFPSPGMQWIDFIKKSVQDLMIHGRLALYKQEGNFYVLPGGDVYPVKSQYVAGIDSYVQMSDFLEPQIFFPDEMAFTCYMPNSGVANGMTPIDVLINLVSAQINHEKFMAGYADGDAYPQKLVVFGEDNPSFDFSGGFDKNMLDKDEQARIKYAINQRKKDNAIQVLSGYGTPIVLDLSRENTMAELREWRNIVDKSVAMVFNLSNNEINQTGSDGTSGRSTSEVQQKTDNSKNTKALTDTISSLLNYEVIPDKFGFGYKIEFIAPVSDEEKITLAKMKSESGLYTKNEIRLELGLDPVPGEENEILQTPAAPAPAQGMA